MRLGYEKNHLTSQTYYAMTISIEPSTVVLSYNDDALLTVAQLQDSTLRSERGYTPSGILQSYTVYRSSESTREESYTYDANDRELSVSGASGGTAYSGITEMGLPMAQTTTSVTVGEVKPDQPPQAQWLTDQLTNSYVGYRDWHLSKMEGTRTNNTTGAKDLGVFFFIVISFHNKKITAFCLPSMFGFIKSLVKFSNNRIKRFCATGFNRASKLNKKFNSSSDGT